MNFMASNWDTSLNFLLVHFHIHQTLSFLTYLDYWSILIGQFYIITYVKGSHLHLYGTYNGLLIIIRDYSKNKDFQL